MRTINTTFKIEDNDLVEYAFEKSLRDNYGSALKDYQRLPDTKELYDNDPAFRKICKEEKEIKRLKNDYINNYNFK